jgi:hypothetical protein
VYARQVLREDMDFGGFVVSDCGAIADLVTENHYASSPVQVRWGLNLLTHLSKQIVLMRSRLGWWSLVRRRQHSPLCASPNCPLSNFSQAAALGIRAGTDVDCGSTYRLLPDAVAQGLLSEEDVDRSLKNVLNVRWPRCILRARFCSSLLAFQFMLLSHENMHSLTHSLTHSRMHARTNLGADSDTGRRAFTLAHTTLRLFRHTLA